jgi:2-dehydropantoate 2-reductase
MRIAVWGAGAIGGITGAALARAGQEVLLVDINEAHVAAMKQHGLHIEDPAGDWHTRVEAATPDEVRGPLGMVLLAVKGQATSGALDQIVPRLTDRSLIVSLQNGLNEEIIAARIGADRTIGCLVNWAADWIAPGRIQFGGHGSFLVGELDGVMTARVASLASLLSIAMPAKVTDNIWGYLWAKTCFGALLFATALTDEAIHEVVERSFDIQHMLVLLVAEGMAVARAAGVRLESFDEYEPSLYSEGARGDHAAIREAMAAVSRFYRAQTKVKSGIWRDLAIRKRRTEVEAQLGAITAKGESLGVPTPLTTRLVVMIHELEEGRRSMGWANLTELVGLM